MWLFYAQKLFAIFAIGNNRKISYPLGVISAADQQVDHKDEKVSSCTGYCVYYSIAQTFMNIMPQNSNYLP